MNRSHNADTYEEQMQRIRRHLQKPDVQERIHASIDSARNNATVTTSGAARLLDLGEQQLRDWEKRGLISTTRLPVEGKQTQGHRQFSLDELSRLAVIKELVNAGNFTPGDFENISNSIEEIWHEVVTAAQTSFELQEQTVGAETHLPIDMRVIEGRLQLFWRFYLARDSSSSTTHQRRQAIGNYRACLAVCPENGRNACYQYRTNWSSW
jgi:MerR HTH family regulatory protein